MALDPAHLIFEDGDYDDVLTPEDGSYVEVIHTNGGFAGFLKPLGDVDFYPNGGIRMPGCGLDPLRICTHQRAVEYFVESLNSFVGFLGQRCANFESVTSDGCDFIDGTKMLGLENNSGKGIYWLQTNSEPPFAQ